MTAQSKKFVGSPHACMQVLWSKDQLTKAVKKGQAFTGYQEGPLCFRPTYKYDVGTDNYDTSSKVRSTLRTSRALQNQFFFAQVLFQW